MAPPTNVSRAKRRVDEHYFRKVDQGQGHGICQKQSFSFFLGK